MNNKFENENKEEKLLDWSASLIERIMRTLDWISVYLYIKNLESVFI